MSDGILENKRSLVDTAYHHSVDLWVVFMELDKNSRVTTRSPFWRLLKKNFRHVECWKYIPPGAWLRFNTGVELITPEVYATPPWEMLKHLNPTVIKVQRLVPQGYWREPFFMGPLTCVELVKAFLGLRKFTVRTPFQLFNFLRNEREKSS